MPLDPTIAIIFGTLLLSLLASLLYAFWYQQFKYKHKTSKRRAEQDASRSIAVSELEELIRKAVGEATRSLEDRVAAMEEDVRFLQAIREERAEGPLPDHKPEPLLRLPDDEAGEAASPSPRRRVR